MNNPYLGVTPTRLLWSLIAVAVAIGLVTAPLSCSNGRIEKANVVLQCKNATRFDPKQRTALESTKAFVACVDAKSDEAGRRSFAERRKLFDALPNTPCEYVGIWAATRGDEHYRVVLDEDGSFHADAYRDTARPRTAMSGSWGIAGKQIVWMYDTGLVWPPDVNTITPLGKDAFELKEVDGSTTRYDLLDRTPFERCGPQGQS